MKKIENKVEGKIEMNLLKKLSNDTPANATVSNSKSSMKDS